MFYEVKRSWGELDSTRLISNPRHVEDADASGFHASIETGRVEVREEVDDGDSFGVGVVVVLNCDI
jgi:hypothetical protein